MAVKESKRASETIVAIIFGVTGLVGKELARKLISSRSKWKVYGVARRPEVIVHQENENFHFISCDLLNPEDSFKKLSPLEDITHVFWVTWAYEFPLDSQECCEQNKFMMSNALNAILPGAKSLKHVSLQTGTKHYISLQGPFNDQENKIVRYYNEQCPRVSNGVNFYYSLEDLLTERLAGTMKNWSVHRPGLILGCSRRTLYNFVGSLCVFGSICKVLNLPFLFGGTKECWEEICIDASDARLVAEQHIWSATTDHLYCSSSSNYQAFNATNGPSFTWKEIWPEIGKKFGVTVPENALSENFLYSKAMGDKGGTWKEIVAQKGLISTKMEELANWDFLDALFHCPVKMLGTREKADGLGFTTKYQPLDSILYSIDAMKEEKLIP
ncbi:oxidoreductase [Lithospermum erythrorhizon]|uniref:Oxidoreductase n=1 Tax=Lithospermum erythrorhizon TaxID=34254 RepID=A0AAV3R5Y6_LITER